MKSAEPSTCYIVNPTECWLSSSSHLEKRPPVQLDLQVNNIFGIFVNTLSLIYEALSFIYEAGFLKMRNLKSLGQKFVLI